MPDLGYIRRKTRRYTAVCQPKRPWEGAQTACGADSFPGKRLRPDHGRSSEPWSRYFGSTDSSEALHVLPALPDPKTTVNFVPGAAGKNSPEQRGAGRSTGTQIPPGIGRVRTGDGLRGAETPERRDIV